MAKSKATKTADHAAKGDKPAKSTHVTTTVRRSTARKRLVLREELVLGTLIAELLGTFILTTVALTTSNTMLFMAFAMIFVVMLLSRFSTGFFNPAITLALLAARKLSALKALGFIVAQFLGAMLALVIVTQFMNSGNTVDQTTGQALRVFELPLSATSWRPFFAEALGALMLGFGAMVVRDGNRTAHEAGFVLGGALLLGLIISYLGSGQVLNPAEALGLGAYKLDHMWDLWAYLAGPIVGAIAGAWLYKLMKWDTSADAKEA